MWTMSQSRHIRHAAVASALLACAFLLPSARAIAPTDHQVRASTHRTRTVHRSAKPLYPSPAPATAAFGLDLLNRFSPGNVVLSPDSVATALAMVGSGATGPTARQIVSALHLRTPAQLGSLGALQREISLEQNAAAHGSSQQATVEIANDIFLQHGLATKAPFLTGLERNFGAVPQTVDFANGSEAVQTINAWVSEHTQGIIPAAVDSLPASTELALANAIYLKASWLAPFKTNATAPAPFHAAEGAASVPFMNETEELPYAHGRGYYAIDIPYAASTLSMMVVLPSHRGVARLQHELSPAMLAQIVHGLSKRPVALSLPRFHIAFKQSLVATLQQLGMTDAFNPAKANFSGISAEKLVLNEVAHAADLKVDEEGTIAAASTVVGAEATSARAFRRTPVRFNADRPFLFFLRDDRSGAVLFAGRLSNAAQAQN